MNAHDHKSLMSNTNADRLRKTLSSPSETLCDLCENAKAVALFSKTCEPGFTLDWQDYGYLKDVKSRDWCPICRLLTTNFHQDNTADSPRVSLVAISTSNQGHVEFSHDPKTFYNTIYLIESTKLLNTEGKLFTRPHLGSFGVREWQRDHLISDDDVGEIESSESAQLECGRAIDATQINWSLVSQWLQRCSTNHGMQCRELYPEGEYFRPLRLIDVVEMRLVETPAGAQWVTLSYMWGSRAYLQGVIDNWKDLFAVDGFTRVELPGTISDAIVATKKLGYRYLWIDAVCIDQNNAQEKMIEIGRMLGIFAESVLTLVALDGSDANAGLAGVRPRSRDATQYFAKTGGRVLMTARPSLQYVLDNSMWSTRGWTYQEQALASRCLYFSHHQLYFQCRVELWTEDVTLEAPLHDGGHFPDLQKSYVPPVMRGSQTLFHMNLGTQRLTIPTPTTTVNVKDVFELALQRYKQRQLTNKEDSIAAFSGTATLLSKNDYTWTICGIPAKYFTELLCWGRILTVFDPCAQAAKWDCFTAPHYSTHRFLWDDQISRIQLPSWSWAGWPAEEVVVTQDGVGHKEHFDRAAQVLCAIREYEHMCLVFDPQLHRDYKYMRNEEKNPRSHINRAKAAIAKCLLRSSTHLNTIFLVVLCETAKLTDLLSVVRAGKTAWQQRSNSEQPGHGFVRPQESFDVTENTKDCDLENIRVLAILEGHVEQSSDRRVARRAKRKKCLLIQVEDSIGYRRGVFYCAASIWEQVTKKREYVVVA